MKWVNRVSGNSSLIQEDNGDSIFHCKDNKTRLIKKKFTLEKIKFSFPVKFYDLISVFLQCLLLCRTNFGCWEHRLVP